jgi:hypothetical protein
MCLDGADLVGADQHERVRDQKESENAQAKEQIFHVARSNQR